MMIESQNLAQKSVSEFICVYLYIPHVISVAVINDGGNAAAHIICGTYRHTQMNTLV